MSSSSNSPRLTPERSTSHSSELAGGITGTDIAIKDSRAQPWKEVVQEIQNKDADGQQAKDGADWFKYKQGIYYSHTS